MSLRTYSSPKFLLRNALRKMGLEVSRYRPRGQENFPKAIEPEFIALYKKYQSYSMVKWSGLYNAWRAVRYIEDASIKGAVVECGVWEGGCTAIMADALNTPRDFYLYDTFEGMSEPTEEDYSFATNQSADDLYSKYNGDWSAGALDVVKHVMNQTKQPHDKTYFVQGKVEDTIPNTCPDKIALLRLDTDWYESTKHELEHLYPKLAIGGVLIIDDYGAWAGSKQATDEYFDKHGNTPFFKYDPMTGNICGIKRA